MRPIPSAPRAGDPRRMDGRGTFAQARLVDGYGAMIDFLAAECRKPGVGFRFGRVSAIEARTGRRSAAPTGPRTVATRDPDRAVALLQQIALPPAHEKAAAADDIGFGNVIKLLLRFTRRWWNGLGGRDLSDLLFLLSDEKVPVWWTQHPSEHPVLTGWLAGPATASWRISIPQRLIDAGINSLAAMFGLPS